jgi:hypothetical protein
MGKAEASVEELVGMIERGELRLPEMQRRFVWRSTYEQFLSERRKRIAEIHLSRPFKIALYTQSGSRDDALDEPEGFIGD